MWRGGTRIVETGEDSDDKGSSFPRTRLRLRNHISRRVGQQKGKSFLLNLRGFGIVHGVEAFENILVSFEKKLLDLVKRHDGQWNSLHAELLEVLS